MRRHLLHQRCHLCLPPSGLPRPPLLHARRALPQPIHVLTFLARDPWPLLSRTSRSPPPTTVASQRWCGLANARKLPAQFYDRR